MTNRILHSEGGGHKPKLWLGAYGDLYAVPVDRADLERALHFERRLTAHLARVIVYLAASKGGTR